MNPARYFSSRARGAALAVLMIAMPAMVASADDVPEKIPAEQVEAEQKAAEADVAKVEVVGPATIHLADQGVIAMPEGTAFVQEPQAGRLLRAYGNSPSGALIGIVLNKAPGASWWAKLEFVKAGYVQDDDAKKWDADELLQNLKDGTKSQNAERERLGLKASEVTG